MAEAIEFNENEVENTNPILDNARKVYLVGLGAAAYTVTFTTDYAGNARGNITELTEKLIDRGQETDQQTRDRLSKQTSSQQKELRNRQKQLEKEVSKRMESFLHALNIPTKKDINSLSNKVSRLNKKVDELSKAQ